MGGALRSYIGLGDFNKSTALLELDQDDREHSAPNLRRDLGDSDTRDVDESTLLLEGR